MRLTAAQKRAERKNLEKNRRAIEYFSFKNAMVEVRCVVGHPSMRSISRYDKKGRVVSVMWVCGHPGCNARYEVNPKKMREERMNAS